MKRINKLLALLLCAAVIFSTILVQGFASETETADTSELTQPEAEPAASASGAVEVTHDGVTTYYDTLQEAFDGFAPSNNTYGGTYVVTLLDDTAGFHKNLQYPTATLDITLDLNGHTITGPASKCSAGCSTCTIGVNINFGSNQAKGSVLTIKDSSGNNSGKITGGKGGVKLDGTDCILNFTGGTITGNHGGSKGGGIFMGAKSFLNMTGGVITGNSVQGTSSANSGYGGGVLANYGSITGGVITGNVANKGSHLQTGRGGGVGTEITRTTGYSTLTIANGVVYGNTAGNAGDDVMAQGNGNVKFTLSIGTENWYVDGWNGTKAGSGGGQTDRYNAENPVAYTDGGFTDVKNKTIGLKYVAPTESEKVAPAAPSWENTNVVVIFECMTNGEISSHGAASMGFTFDEKYCTVGEVYENADGKWACDVTVDLQKYYDEMVGYADEEAGLPHRLTNDVEINTRVMTAIWDEEEALWIFETVTFETTCEPEYVAKLESTGEEFETLQAAIDAASVLMVDADHENQTITLLDDIKESVKISWTTGTKTANNFNLTIDLNGHTVTGNGGSVFDIARLGSGAASKVMTVTFNDSVGTGVVTGGNSTYGGAVYNSTAKGKINIVVNGGTWTGNTATNGGGAISSNYTTSTYVYINGGTFTGNTAGSNGGAIYARNLYMTGGEITGNSANSGGGVYVFTAASTILDMTGGKIYGNTATTDGDDIIWRANRGTTSTAYLKLLDAATMGIDNVDGWYLDGSDARYSEENAVEFENYAKYTTLNSRIALKAAEKILVAPEAPDKYGENVMSNLIQVICDTDEDHAPINIKWQHQSTKVRDWESGVVWSDEHNAWIVPVRIDDIYTYYVYFNFDKVYNSIEHNLVDEEQSTIDTYLKWDAEKELWVTLDDKPIDVHVCCKTTPDVPKASAFGRRNFQIQVMGDLDGDGIFGENGLTNDGVWEMFATSIPTQYYENLVVYGSREEGFFIDVTVNLEDGDIFITNWIEKRVPGQDYAYNWDLTQKSITFTLKYDRSLTGTLYGNDVSDWVLASNGEIFGKVGEAFVRPAMPAAPKQENVVADLVTIICDSDAGRHVPVTGKWYPQHCETTSDIVWNTELNAWTVDIRIGSLYIMYVNQLEDANNGTTHELIDDITTVYSTLKWDAQQALWVPVEDIELHTTCRTAPVAPAYKQIKSYQIKVWGNIKGEWVAYTTSVPEDSYTLSEVYGSREEGFFVDVTFTLQDDDAFITSWVNNKAPEGIDYGYDWTKTPQTLTFTLKYNGSLNGTLYGDRHAVNTNYDWVLLSNGKTYGVVGEAYAKPVPEAVNIVFRFWLGTNMGTINQKMTYGEPLTLRANSFKRTGYTFDHWNSKRDTDDGKFTFADGATVTVEQVHDLYLYALANDGKAYLNAYWKPITYTIKYNGGEGSQYIGSQPNHGANWMLIKNGYAYDVPVVLDNGADFVRPGYKLAGWKVGGKIYAPGETVDRNFTDVQSGTVQAYAVWEKDCYTLTLDANGGTVDPASIVVTYDSAIGELPVPTKVKATFLGWYDAEGNEVTAETIYTVAGDSTITAKWLDHPSVSNVTNELFTIQCSVKHEHSWLCNWFGSHLQLVKDSVKWNAEQGRWEAQIKTKSSMLSLINSSTTKKNYFGGMTHHYDQSVFVFDVYFDPNFTGLSSSKKEVTGMWLPVQEYVIPVFCYTEPSMPDISKISGTMIWARDAGNKNATHSQKFTVKQLVEGSYTVGKMYTENGKFYVDITVTDLSAVIKALGEKTGKSYVLPAWEKHYNSAADFSFTLEYTGSATDYKQDGTGWSIAASTWANNSEKLNGKSLWLTEQFTVTYTDGIEDKEFFADQIFTVNAYTENGASSNAVTDFSATATPTIEDPSFVNYIFNGWIPAVAETVTETVTYTAQWIQYPGSSSTNVTKELFTIQCTVNHEHSWLCNWFGSHVTFVKDSVKWNEELGRWEAQCKIGSSMMGLINSSTTKKNYFGGITHHYDVTNYTFDLYYDPNFTGLNSQSKEVTGMWLPVQEYVVPVYCYTEPSMPNMAKITNNVIWMRDAANIKNYLRSKLINGTYTVGQMYQKDGAFYVDVTINDLSAYIDAFEAKFCEGYMVGDWTANNTLEDFVFVLKYTGSTTDYKQDGTGWSIEWPNTTEKNNARTLWLTKQYTVTYTDGAEGKVFADQVFTVFAMTETAKDKFTATETPVFEAPARKGYTFAGWTPEVAATVTADATYTAVWTINTYNITVETNAGGNVTVQSTADFNEVVKIAITPNAGYSVASAKLVYVSDGIPVTTNLMNAERFRMPAADVTVVVEFFANDYTLTLDANGGKVEPATLTVTFDAAVGTLPAPERTGYTFNGWFDAEGNEVTAETVYTIVGDSTVTAKWTANQYTLTLDANGGKVEPATLTVTFDAAVGTLPAPERTGYTFNGWFDAEGNEVTAETVYTVADNSTVTAKWSANQYTLTLDANGGKVDPATLTVTFDAAVGTLPAPERTGYTFNGWFDAEGNEVTAETVYTTAAGSTITAQWVAKTYTVTLVPNGGKVSHTTITVTYDAPIGTLPLPKRDGYFFGCWVFNNVAFTADTIYTNDGDMKLYASWFAKTYTLTLDAGEGTVDPATLTVTFDAAIGTLPVPQREGYTFEGWFDAEGKEVTAETVYTTTDNSTVTAKWTANKYTLTLDNGEQIEVAYGQPIGTLPTPEREGYTFEGWFDANGNEVTAETVYTGDGTMTLTAKWSANGYAIKLEPGEGALNEGDPDLIGVTYGAPVGEMPVPVYEGYIFMGWYDEDGVLVAEDTVYMYNGGITAYAEWEQIPEETRDYTIYIVIALVVIAGAVVAVVVTKKRAVK